MSVAETQTLTRVIAALLEDPRAGKGLIEVRNERGTITLSGLVPRPEDRSGVEQIVRQQTGVVAVINDLRVTPEQTPMALLGW
ncbi:MAG TPA: BON domain-containing protein [Anaerolineae bacterium]|nr:BON domain-containing protein [Anaerolineae bacterium]